MKRIIIGLQIVVLLLILAKAASVFGVLHKTGIKELSGFLPGNALAQQPPDSVQTSLPDKAATTPPVQKDTMDEILVQQRGLAEALAARKAQLDERENALKADEQRLMALRREITEKIALLSQQEERLAAALDAAREEDVRRYKDMAKVYENTPPAKAGPMFEKLDTKTAAGITMNMKKEKAGALWAYISPQKAVEITREITRTGGTAAVKQ
ncbi:MAG TPA: hypothetical protein PK090_06215 [Smithellaceae bacterium]|jgi:flagellar motility protein MotE (MotC chaperone)|nr:hypothetical protein [Smithellaceae bacterium]